jgi:hypothetical protein
MTSDQIITRAAAAGAFADASAAVLEALGLGERDADLLDLVEKTFLDRLGGARTPLDDLISQACRDPADVRRWWSGWA